MDSELPKNTRVHDSSHSSGPRLWVLADDRPGNSTQSLGLAEALGWPYEVKDLRFGSWSRLHNRWLGASNRSLRPDTSSVLQPPWPDLVIAAGRRVAPIALWIREQSAGRTKLVQLGRKGGDLADLFDLVVTPRYTRQLQDPRRLETLGPLHRIDAAKLEQAADEWRTRLMESTHSPRIVVLVGGTSGQYRLDVETARRLGERLLELARTSGGSLLISVSRRTGAAAADVLEAALGEEHYFYRWSPGGGDNPYLAYLALADAFVITADSESMIVEACSTTRPVYIWPLPVRLSWKWLRFNREWIVTLGSSYRSGDRSRIPGMNAIGRACSWLQEQGYVRPARDLALMHEDLVARGMARHFGAPFEVGRAMESVDDVAKVVRRVRELMEETPAD
jgi:mitochondrial fission protein ELM1